MTCLNYDRIYAQYRDKPKAVAWYGITPSIGNEICSAYNSIVNSYDIDSNEGAQLDVIGRLIGTNRSIIVDVAMDVCEFGAELQVNNNYIGYGNTQYGAGQYNGAITLTPDCEMGDPASQMSEISIGSDAQLKDMYFRPLLKSKVAKNTSEATIDDIIEAVKIIATSADVVTLQDSEDMTFSLEIFGNLSAIERDILLQDGVVPKPQGVAYLGFVETTDLVEFGSQDFEMGDELSQMAGYTGN